MEREFIRNLAKNAESRFIDYKKQKEDLFKSKQEIDPEWMKFLKEMEKFEKHWLSKIREEIEYLNQELNPPFCYPKKIEKEENKVFH